MKVDCGGFFFLFLLESVIKFYLIFFLLSEKFIKCYDLYIGVGYLFFLFVYLGFMGELDEFIYYEVGYLVVKLFVRGKGIFDCVYVK